MPPAVYAAAAPQYFAAGWPGIIPVPVDKKAPPPDDTTGAQGVDRHPQHWLDLGLGEQAIALRLPDGIIGIDVDHYTTPAGVVKTGGDTLARACEQWGPLPPTWSVTARGPGQLSRTSFYRCAGGRYATKIDPDVDIIQRHHRYSVVAPSPHYSGEDYQWYRPDGSPADPGEVPRPEQLAELTAPWEGGLRAGATGEGVMSADHASGEALLAMVSTDLSSPCSVMGDAIYRAQEVLNDPALGTRHDTTLGRVHRLIQLAAWGHSGFGSVLDELREKWAALTPGEDRAQEFERMMLSSARKGVTAIGGVRGIPDPCLAMGGGRFAGVPVQPGERPTIAGANVAAQQYDARPRPIDHRPAGEEEHEPLPELPPVWRDPSWAEVIGAHEFIPDADLDQPLADAMLVRVRDMVRRTDLRNAWLMQGAEQWELVDDLSGRIVKETVDRMPVGDPSPPAKGDPPSDAQRAFARRKRLSMNAGASAVAASIRRATDGGRHPLTVRLRDLDQEPEVLWAGRVPWDLRASGDGPVMAGYVSQWGPHLKAAGVGPDPRIPTPAWDRFLAAVWPDPAVRAWCLRVLGVTLVGVADAALPVLYGPGGTGKTSIAHLIMGLLGSYAVSADPALLDAAKSNGFHIFDLKGARFAFIDEAMRESKSGVTVVKQLTGGGMLKGSLKHQNGIDFAPTHTLVLTSNTPPAVSESALQRRVRVLPCEGDPDEVRARRQALNGLRWAGEAPGVLAALMREAAAWLANPDSALVAAAPLQIQTLMGQMADEQDPLGQWLEDATTPSEPGTRSRDLYVSFRGWCRDGGWPDSRILTETAWGTQLKDLGYPPVKHRDANYRALTLRAPGGFSYGGTVLPFPVEGRAPFVEGGGGSAPQPSTGGMPRSTEDSAPVVEGVEGSSIRYIHKRDTLKDVGVKGKGGSTLHSAEKISRPTRANTGGGSDTPNPPHSTAGAPAGKGRTRLTDEEKALRAVAKKQAKAAEREQERLAAVQQASGPTYTLPVVVGRSGEIREVPPAEAVRLADLAARHSGALTVDVEHTGYPIGHEHFALRSVQLGDADLCVILDPVAHAPYIIEALTGEFPLHAHSATADLVPLALVQLLDYAHGWDRMIDTAILSRSADPTLGTAEAGLKKLSPGVLGRAAVVPAADEARKAVFTAGKWLTDTDESTPIERNGWAQIDTASETMIRYAAADVLDTAAIARTLPHPPPAILARERLAQRMTARVTIEGVALDGERVAMLTAQHEGELARHGAIVRSYDIDNPGSGKQVAERLLAMGAQLPRTEHGNPSVAEGVLEPFASAGGDVEALAGAVLGYRGAQTALGLFLRPYRALIEHGDGRARPTIYTMGADTGRMSAVRPNIQQLPRAGGMRACLVADSHELMIGADFSGVELRVAAALSQDPTLLQFFRDGRDLHAEIALQVYGRSDPKASAKAGRPVPLKTDRYRVKPGVFGWLYGGGVPTLSKQMGTTPDIAQRMVNVLEEMVPRLVAWTEDVRQRVRAGHTTFTAYSGRVIHLQRQYPHKAPNYVIQGTARELLIDALCRWNDTKWGHYRLLPVHDELDSFVPAGEADEATRALCAAMATTLDGVDIVADPSEPSPFWADSE